MGKKNPELIAVYKDTLEKVPGIKGDIDTTVTSKYKLDDHTFLPIKHGVIEVVNMDSVSAAIRAIQKDPYAKICILNMASRKKPGGGVKNGAKSQEEDLFRCTTLGMDISDKHYPLKEDEFVYTEGAYVFKNKNYEDIFPFKVDVVTMPAINLNGGGWNEEKKEYEVKILEKPPHYTRIMVQKIRTMCGMAARRGCTHLILGAWGCGVFKNEPAEVALHFKTVLVHEGFATQFKSVVFPVINDRNSQGNNYKVFKALL